jgi:hypothetical protein
VRDGLEETDPLPLGFQEALLRNRNYTAPLPVPFSDSLQTTEFSTYLGAYKQARQEIIRTILPALNSYKGEVNIPLLND